MLNVIDYITKPSGPEQSIRTIREDPSSQFVGFISYRIAVKVRIGPFEFEVRLVISPIDSVLAFSILSAAPVISVVRRLGRDQDVTIVAEGRSGGDDQQAAAV